MSTKVKNYLFVLILHESFVKLYYKTRMIALFFYVIFCLQQLRYYITLFLKYMPTYARFCRFVSSSGDKKLQISHQNKSAKFYLL